MQELIKVTVAHSGEQTVSARELWGFLEVKTAFSHWCSRMFEYGFEENRDFMSILTESTGGRPSIDYALTLDTAKEIAMLQRSDKGKQARQYFIECEKQLRQQVKPLTQSELILQSAQALVDHERRLTTMEQDVQQLKAVHDSALAQLSYLPMSDDEMPEETTRAKVTRLVNTYCRTMAVAQQEVWNHIYEKMYYVYRVSIKSYKKQRTNETWVEVAERCGHIDKMFTIISDLVKKSEPLTPSQK
ncbi:antA/AntB antirepressor family protein [Runella salmonicolor]|uniref:AntA/AntB antirepressor family protein n=1 Tax=Runella salmonicolor TaxID=2950278 RepID=A0ABT1FSV6_9BACT|nr:antA/AntB antirepressor family protein [Runella salmonicolor]MCP1384824.1 antA/AntB antirepressor family protein [Runella salmonicolor]